MIVVMEVPRRVRIARGELHAKPKGGFISDAGIDATLDEKCSGRHGAVRLNEATTGHLARRVAFPRGKCLVRRELGHIIDRATDRIEHGAHDTDAEAIPRCWHGGLALPRIGGRIIRFDGVETGTVWSGQAAHRVETTI